ncbi:MAG: FAD-dependent oxidoreductase [Deltaproteobacteria bacterium]|nr:FAD-dependent oxidoreductase [Deltaproteobacteria bacterium]NIS77542.1 FAD-dependent oxidoreductase [Deltaproteobacteria bacterium]
MRDEKKGNKVGAAMVLGGGIGGMEAALSLAESGIKVYLVDSNASIGGVMSQLDKTFPTNDCAMCTMAPRLVSIGRHKDIEILSMSAVEVIKGEPGNFTAIINKKSRYVNEEKCTGCGSCVSNCPTRKIVQPVESEKIVLDQQFREEVLGILEKHKGREGLLMPILQDINATFNYLPENVLKYVAQETGYSLSHILKIATFYGAFSTVPRGKNIIYVCTGTTCYVRGSERLMEKFSDILGIDPEESTPDMNFTLTSARCIGCCGLAPAVMIGDEVHGRFTSREIPEIINKYGTG